jgi:hypothetical protein
METCTIETGLLRKKPCGANAVTHCATCEQPLCTQHALPQLTSMGKKTGTYLCKECQAAQKSREKGLADVAKREDEKKRAALQKEAMAPMPERKPVKPAAPAAPAAGAPAKDKPDDSGSIEFTPSKPPEPGKK